MTTSLAPEPSTVAAHAAQHAGVAIEEISTPREHDRAAELLREVWAGDSAPVPANLMRVVQLTGGYVFGAYDTAGTLLAVSMGLLAERGLHSHITGVVPGGRRQGLGFALKQHQRSWALENGIGAITWTCDPLVRRNVAFNLHALGADVVGYLPNHYGAMTDGLNAGDESDRFELHWDLLGDRATAAGEGRLPYLVTGSRLVQLPDDIESLRKREPAQSLQWRRTVRHALHPALESGSRIQGLTASGWLVVERP